MKETSPSERPHPIHDAHPPAGVLLVGQHAAAVELDPRLGDSIRCVRVVGRDIGRAHDALDGQHAGLVVELHDLAAVDDEIPVAHHLHDLGRDGRHQRILLDVIMAHMEGPDVARVISEDSALKEIPTIFLTATVTQKEVDEGGGMIGGHPFVAKPSSLETLLDAIDKNIMVV